jgi:hypothetical protein
MGHLPGGRVQQSIQPPKRRLAYRPERTGTLSALEQARQNGVTYSDKLMLAQPINQLLLRRLGDH